MVRCTMLGDEELGRVYHADFFAWYAQRVYSPFRGRSDSKCWIKGGPEPLENEINKILDLKREDRFSDHFPIWYKI